MNEEGTSPRSAPSDRADKFILRFHDDGMRKQLKARAALNERTLNSEVIYLIKRGLAAEAACPSPTAG